jgi:hypothetical protein
MDTKGSLATNSNGILLGVMVSYFCNNGYCRFESSN